MMRFRCKSMLLIVAIAITKQMSQCLLIQAPMISTRCHHHNLSRMMFSTLTPTDHEMSRLLESKVKQILLEVSHGHHQFVTNQDDLHQDFSRESILEALNTKQATDAKACEPFLTSETQHSSIDDSAVEYNWLTSSPQSNRPLAIQTTEAILDTNIISWIRQQAQASWENPTDENEASSRFTYQRKGNYEVHLADLLKQTTDQQAKDAIHHALTKRIYPTIRNAFGKSLGDDGNSLLLSVYDAIVIQYNATEASSGTQSSIGAGQPLHRDLGLVSVNVMLNDETYFRGGGTFFEHQLESVLCDRDYSALPLPLKPLQPGHALMHLSSDRHAGASTQSGVRDILVFFITATRNDNTAPKLERAARLKSLARPSCLACQEQSPLRAAICRAQYHTLSVESVPCDGEAWQYLGMALWDVQNALSEIEAPEADHSLMKNLVKTCLECFHQASNFTPCDARIYNNLALILSELSTTANVPDTTIEYENHEEIVECFEKALTLHKASHLVGCDVGLEYKSASLNYGLYLANQDLFDQAVPVLATLVNDAPVVTQSDQDEYRQHQIQQDAKSLLDFCQRQLS